MNELIIPQAKLTPSVNFNFQSGIFEMKGNSIPENAPAFYDPLCEAVNQYGTNAQANTVLNIRLNYFNTSSSKCLLKLFSAFSSLHNKVTQVEVNWYHDPDDEDLLETANDLEFSCQLEFNYIAVETE